MIEHVRPSMACPELCEQNGHGLNTYQNRACTKQRFPPKAYATTELTQAKSLPTKPVRGLPLIAKGLFKNIFGIEHES